MRGTGYAIGEVLIFLIIATVIGLIAGYLLGRAQAGGALTDDKLKQKNSALEEKLKGAERRESATRSRLATAQDRISALQSENKELVEIAARRGGDKKPSKAAASAPVKAKDKPEEAKEGAAAKPTKAEKPEPAKDKPEEAEEGAAAKSTKAEKPEPDKADPVKPRKDTAQEPAETPSDKKPATASGGEPSKAEEAGEDAGGETDQALEDLEKKLKELSSQLDDLQS